MKKVLSCLLCASLLFSLSTPVFALSINTVPASQSILSTAEARTLNLVPTETDSVYQAANGKYFVQNSDFYIAVEKMNIPFNSMSTVQEVVNSDDYSPRLKEAIQNYYEYAVRENMTDEITLTLYSSPGFFVDEEGTEEHFGKEMRYQVLDYGTTSTRNKEINSGLDTFAMADNAVNLTINGASLVVVGLGLVNAPVSASISAGISGVSAAKSILDLFRLAFPNRTFTGTTDDFAEVTFHYHYYEKYISVNTDTAGWNDAVTTCKALVDLAKLRVCLYDDETLNMSEKWYNLPQFTVQGESYADPWEAAYNHMFFGLYEPATIEIEDLTLNFGDFIWE